MRSNSRRYLISIPALTLISGAFSWDGNYRGGDIAAARGSYRGDQPIDLWGGFSGFFYGHIPDYIIPWGAWLLVIHLLCTSVGLILIYKKLQTTSKISNLLLFSFSYVVLVFSGYLTRDSTMTAFYILGLGLILNFNNLQKFVNKFLFLSGTLFLILAITFRPWLCFAVLLPLLFLRKYNYKIIIFIILLISSPWSIDKMSYSNANYKKVHPELQVVILDLATMSCTSNNQEIRQGGINILNKISNTNYTNSQICADWRLSTWQSVGKWEIKPEELGLNKRPIVVGSISKISISSNLMNPEYGEIRKFWIKFIAENPDDYLQMKWIQSNQVMLSGDTFGFRYLDSADSNRYIKRLFFLPYDIVISLHLMSPFITLIAGFCILLFNLNKFTIRAIISNRYILSSFSFVLGWIILTAVAYIGDNGRYTYLSTFIFYILLFCGIDNVKTTLNNNKILNLSWVKIEK